MSEQTGQKSKWFKTCKRVVLKCGLKVSASGVNGRQENWKITGPVNEGELWDGRTWKKVLEKEWLSRD